MLLLVLDGQRIEVIHGHSSRAQCLLKIQLRPIYLAKIQIRKRVVRNCLLLMMAQLQ